MSAPSPPRAARGLPASPSLEQQKKQARELLAALRNRDPAARERFRAHHPRFAELSDAELQARSPALHDAQLVIAREYGFASWPKLKAHIDTAVAARRTRPFVRDISYYDDRAHGLLAVVPDGVPYAVDQVRMWHPRFGAASDDEIRSAALTIEDGRLVYARQHGFATWQALSDYLAGLDAAGARDPFMEVFEAGKARDWQRVRALLRRHNDRGWTPLHQAAYRNDPAMAALLLEAGARPGAEAHGAGGTPLAVALFWGHREVAETLVPAGIVPRNLRVAAGLGRVDLAAECFDGDGRLTPEARAGRGFYRPHSGFPFWRPSDDEREVLDEALVWAAKSDRVEVMPLLIDRGADPAIRDALYDATPAGWAEHSGSSAVAAYLRSVSS